MSFVNLHVHSEFSRLDGCGKSQMHAARAAELGQPALALTDHGNMSGVLHHLVACEEHEIKPILGIEAYFRPDVEADRAEQNQYGYFHLVLLAKDMQGWRNLLALTSKSYRDEQFYGKPCVDWELLKKHHEGVIASTTCLSGCVPYRFTQEDERGAREGLEQFLKIFGDDLYVEIQPHDIPEQRVINIALVNLANERGIPVVATSDAHYPTQEWADTHDVLVMCNTQQTFRTRAKAEEIGEDYMQFSGDTFYIMSDGDMRAAFVKNHPELPAEVVDDAIANTLEIASRVEHLNIDRGLKMPKASKGKKDAERIIRQWCEEGLIRIGRAFDETYRERLEKELDVLGKKGVFDYFIVLGDMVRWAKSQRIRVGAGRGSVAGSLVAYLIGLTSVDPIGHDLLFERFLNEHRAEQPDVDIDFQHNRRAEVKEYLKQRWGQDNVVDICSHMTFGPRSAIQVVAKIYDLDYEMVMDVTRTMEDTSGDLGLEDIAELNETVGKFAQDYPEVWKHALRLEGQVRTESKHAAGVVITDKAVYEYMPTMRGKDMSVVTQWSEQAEFPIITKWGFLKIDCLGIDALSRQAEALRLIDERHALIVDFEDPGQFPVVEDPEAGDPAVIRAFGEGMNLGVFQFEGRGISSMLKQIKPTSFKDLVAANALFRPGPLDSGTAWSYGDRKNGHEEYDLDMWGPARQYVEDTLGIMIYQEQAVLIAASLANWDAARADEVRRAITKLSSAKVDTNLGAIELQKQEEEFVRDAVANGVKEEVATEVWRQIILFARYSFNKSHSAGYAMEAYRDMWLKIYYPHEFYTPLLTGEDDKVPIVVREAQAMGIRVIPPDVNRSEGGFTLHGDDILYGLMPIKYVGDSAIAEIVANRPFENYDDFCDRVRAAKVNSRAKTNLVEAGAFDWCGMRDDWTDEAKAEAEKMHLGLSLTTDLIAEHREVIAKRVHQPAELSETATNEVVVVGGEITGVKEIVTKKGQPMAFVDVAFGSWQYATTFFPEQFVEYRHLLKEGTAILVKGTWDRGRETTCVNHCTLLSDLIRKLQEVAA